jgi:hypothetical protein
MGGAEGQHLDKREEEVRQKNPPQPPLIRGEQRCSTLDKEVKRPC